MSSEYPSLAYENEPFVPDLAESQQKTPPRSGGLSTVAKVFAILGTLILLVIISPIIFCASLLIIGSFLSGAGVGFLGFFIGGGIGGILVILIAVKIFRRIFK
jgi:hypothetical protein